MGFLRKLFGNKKPAEKPIESNKLALTPEQMQRVAAAVKTRYCKPVFRIDTTKSEALKLTDSKFGGMPYWPTNLDHPKTSDNEPLVLLAQINFSNEHLNSNLLPKQGLLQFFIAANDHYGLNFGNGTMQDTFRVVYHPSIDTETKAENDKQVGALSNTQLDPKETPFPFYDQFALSFYASTDTISNGLELFDAAVGEAIGQVMGIPAPEKPWKELTSESYDGICALLRHDGSKMLGYPTFTQWDPRHENDGFDTLLLQIDSNMKQHIMWGDCGVANFFISSESLKRCDFSHVLYNWDCY